MTDKEPIVTIKGLTRTFKQGPVEVRALKGVDLQIARGAFAAVVGPSGSGKTTLLNLLGALDKPTSGSICIDGIEITDRSGADLSALRRDRIGFVFQSYNLIPVFTAMENVGFILEMRGVSVAERRQRCTEVLAEVGLAGMEHRRPDELSGGQQQRVAVARAIVSNPAIVLADEPTANLDTATAMDILGHMQTLNRETGTCFVFASHDERLEGLPMQQNRDG